MKYKSPNTLAAVLALAGALPLGAQNAPSPSTSAATDETIVLSPFEVTTTKDNGYASPETLAGTRIRTNLADVASSISVINSQFLKDVGATDSSTLLLYTTNAEVSGTRGSYEGLGNGTTLTESSNLTNPQSANRIRGLAAADNTRDFFTTDIPWDSYNVDRIDIQRGPNAILFGLGSPAGIVNASIHSAEFRNFGNVQDRVGSYGSTRESLDANVDIIPDVLAIRVDGLWDDRKYEQKPAYQNDKRASAAIRFDPQLFKDPAFHTSIRFKYENGSIDAERPRTLAPYDSITPYFGTLDKTVTGGAGKVVVPNGYVIGSTGNTYNPWIGGVANQQQPVWFINGASNELYRIYGGFVNDGALSATGVPQGISANLVGQKYSDVFSDITSYSQYAKNASLPGAQYGQYRDKSLTDSSVFDFYHNLIDGPTASQFEKWNAYNLDIQQSFWDDRVAIDLSGDRQRYKRGGEYLISNPTLDIDILQNFQDYVVGPTNANNSAVANPNFGRPFIQGGPGTGSSYQSDRRYLRGSLFAELRPSDFTHNEFLLKLFGKQDFNFVYSNEDYKTENLTWQEYANSEAYAAYKTQGNPDGIINLPPTAVIYLGPSLASASTASNAHISGITSDVTLQNGNIYEFDATWKPQPGVNYSDPWNVPTNLQPFFNGAPVVNTATNAPYAQLNQASNPANYVGWNSNFQDTLLRYDDGDKSLTTTAAKTERLTKSLAGNWQGFVWNDAIIPTLGWRYDEVQTRAVSALPQTGAVARGALNLDPEVYTLPAEYPDNTTVKAHSFSGGAVVHLNKLFGRHDFLPFNISATYDDSKNFQVTDIRRDVYGNPIANPDGNTKEYGILLSTKDEKYSFRVTKYKTQSDGTAVQGFDITGLKNTIVDAMNWRNIKLYYMTGYNWASAGAPSQADYSQQRYMWDPSYVDNTTGRPVAAGNITTPPPSNSHLETDAQAAARRDAGIQALNDLQTYLTNHGYFNAWNYGVGPTTLSALQTRGQYEASPSLPNTASVYDYRTAPSLQGFAVTADTESKGYEFELTANPLKNWRISLNAAETTAVRSNVGGAALDSLVNYIDGVMGGPGGDLVRFNSLYSAGNELRADWTGWRGQYTLLKLGENADVPELRKWRYNVITNYSFDRGALKGVGVGAAYRWQDKVVIGYPVIPNPTNPILGSFDLTKPYYGPAETALDLWVSYEHKVTKKINWTIQFNIYNVGKKDSLIPISVEPDGHTWAAARIAPTQEWELTNTFAF